jgi:hypothetical protein
MPIARAYRSTNPDAVRYSKVTDVPDPPTLCPEVDALNILRLEHLPKHRAIGEKLSKVRTEKRHADRNYAREAAADVRAGKEPRKDPRPALERREAQLLTDLAISREYLNGLADEIDAVRDAHAATWVPQEKAFRQERLEAAQAMRADLEYVLAEVGVITGRIAWANGGKILRQPIGSKELNALGKAIAEAIKPLRVRWVAPDQMARLQHGREAITLDGETLPAGTSPASVRLSHSPDGWQESPLGKAGDRA